MDDEPMPDAKADDESLSDPKTVARLKDLPKKVLPLLKAPSKTKAVDLHASAPKTFRLGNSGRRMNSDATFSVEREGKLVCFSLQAEEWTAGNISSLIGKCALALFCGDSSRPIGVERSVAPAGPTGKPGRPATKPQPQRGPVDQVHVLMLAPDGKLHDTIRDLKTFFDELVDFKLGAYVHAVVVDPENETTSAAAVQATIDKICAKT